MKPFLCLLLAAFAVRTFAAAPAVVSSGAQASVSAAGNSFNPTFSADGLHLVFVSHANNLVTNDDLNPWLDVFVRDLVSSNTVLVSVGAGGLGGANADANFPSVSSNGQFIAFASRASNLTAGDTNNASDVFVRDVVNGITRLVSVDVNGNAPGDPAPSLNLPLSGSPQISADGRWVFFESRALNLVAGGAPLGSVNIYARDTWSNATVLVSPDVNGNAVVGKCTLANITPDARWAAFTTADQSLMPAVNNSGVDVYIRDLQSGSTLWASTNAFALLGGNYSCTFPTLAGNGTGLAFHATVTSSGSTYPMFFDLPARIRQRLFAFPVSNAPSVISADGTAVAFEGSSNGWTQILLWDRASNAVSVAHQKQFGNFPSSPSHVDTLSTNARFMVLREIGVDSPYFTTNVVPRYHLFRKDLVTSSLELLSGNTNQAAGAGDFQFATVAATADAGRIAFDSPANDLAAQDRNGASDIFLRDMNTGATELITPATSTKPAKSSSAHSFLGLNSLSADGRYIVSTRYDDPSVYRDTNGLIDVFVSDAVSGTSLGVSLNATVYFTNTDGGSSGGPGTLIENTNTYRSPIISADGGTIAAVLPGFYSYVSVARASNGVFTSSGMRVASRGVVASFSDSPALSADGLLLAFRSDANDLNPNVNDANNVSDVWLRYYFAGTNGLYYATNYLMSVATDNSSSGYSSSIAPSLKGDGGIVVFATKAGNLLPTAAGGVNPPYPEYAKYQIMAALTGTNRNDTNYLVNIPKRLCSYTMSFQQYDWIDSNNTNIHRTNLNAILTPLTVDATNSVLSAQGRHVVFSLADGSAVWRHDLLATQSNYTFVSHPFGSNYITSIVATNLVPGSSNVLVCSSCRNPSVSADGSIVTFERVRAGTSLVDLFAVDLNTGFETRVSGNLAGGVANGSSTTPFISGDGRYVVFQSRASDLVPHDTNGVSDIFVRDRLLGVTMLVSANAQGRAGNGASARPVLAADGRTVAFQSFASDLAGGDFNDKRDVFLLRLGSADSDGDGMDDDWEMAYFNTLARDGSGDFDTDGVSDLGEFRAGTDPTNSNSVFRVLTVAPAGGGSALLLWTGNPARTYRAEFKDDLGAANWTALSGNISWNGATASLADASATNSPHRYYRVLRLP